MAEKGSKKTKTTKEVIEEEEVIKVDEEPKAEKEEEKVEDSDEVSLEEGVESKEDEVIGEEEKLDEKPSDYFAKSTVYADDSSTATVEKKFSGKRLMFFLVVIAVSAGIFFAGLMFFNVQFSNMGIPSPLSQPTPTSAPTPEATPTPQPEVNVSDYNTQVLNGSGVSGAAAAVADLLEAEGFEDVAVGNAEDQDMTDTEVQLKAGVPDEVYSIISQALSDYTVVEGEELDDDSQYDVIVIVGQSNEGSDSESDEPTPTQAEEN